MVVRMILLHIHSRMNISKKFPAIFLNHGGGPLPLLGEQPELVAHMKDIVSKHIPVHTTSCNKPKAIVVVSAHYEAKPIEITSSKNPSMIFDYYGFPPETYQYDYPAPGHPELASEIHRLLSSNSIDSNLNEERGFDHGVFIPLMFLYPEHDIPVVCVSLDKSLDASSHLLIGKALAPLQDEGILLLGSGYTFHNLNAFFNPTPASKEASVQFNEWLKETILQYDGDRLLQRLKGWKDAPGARICHPREEHLLPLFVIAAAGAANGCSAHVIYDTTNTSRSMIGLSELAVTGFLFG